MKDTKNLTSFGTFGIITICAVYFLILVGGIVRSSGSGMGCPDWPKCFGKWVPPANVSELPENYKEIFIEKRRQKNIKFAAMLELFNYKELSQAILNDKSVYIGHDFNPLQTWIEYLNRIVGVTIGFLIIAVCFKSLAFWHTDKAVVFLSVSSLLLVVFQGWLGSIVVSTNLMPFMITLHMGLAIVLVGLLIYVIARSQREKLEFKNVVGRNKIQWIVYLLIAGSFFQIISGTQVREKIDVIAASMNYMNRGEWLSKTGLVFYFHRSFSILLVLIHLILLYLIYKNNRQNMAIYKSSVLLIALLGFEVMLALMLSYMGFPAYAQPLHLTVGCLIIGVQFYLAIVLHYSNKPKLEYSKSY